MTIYLAGPWSQRDTVRLLRRQFEAAGINVKSDWIDWHGGATDDAGLRQEALHDLRQIHSADAFVVVNLEVSEGKACEFMWAYSKHKPTISVGETPNIFHTLATYRVHTVQEAIVALHSHRPALRS